MRWKAAAERYFEFSERQTNWPTELLAGGTTFVTMAYIVFVNPAILHDAGVPWAGVATCLSAAFGSILMGLIARYPIALAPGMGLNAYFAYTVVKALHIPWQTALGAVFLSGVLFLVLTLLGIRQLLVAAIPKELYSAVAVGIGLFIAFIGLKNSGLIVAQPATFVTMGNLREGHTALSLFGLLVMSALMVRGVRAAILIGIGATTLLGFATGVVTWPTAAAPSAAANFSALAGQLDIRAALRLGLLEIVFVFLFVDLFDNMGTLMAVSKQAGLLDRDGHIPRLNRILFADACATIFGSFAGTSTVVSYIESSAGVAAGGRTGVTSIVTGLLFLAALAIAPLAGVIPNAATAPALIVVGSLMVMHVADIPWGEPLIAIPAFLTVILIPLSFSIANGLAFGFAAYTLLHIAAGRAREISVVMWILTALLIARFVYLGQG